MTIFNLRIFHPLSLLTFSDIAMATKEDILKYDKEEFYHFLKETTNISDSALDNIRNNR